MYSLTVGVKMGFHVWLAVDLDLEGLEDGVVEWEYRELQEGGD